MASNASTPSTGAENQAVGKVFIQYGTAKAVAADGTERALAPNSPIFAHDQIITDSDGSVSIQFDGPPVTQLDLGRMSQVTIDEDVYAGAAPGVTADAAAEAEQIQQALLEGDQPIDLEATAAGGDGGAGGGVTSPFGLSLTGAEGEVGSGAGTTGPGDLGTGGTIQGAYQAPNDTNIAPVAHDVTATGTEDSVSIPGVADATDADGNALTYSIVGEPPAGVTFNADGTFSVAPLPADQALAAGESREITFQYIANDGTADSEPATVTVTVDGTNDVATFSVGAGADHGAVTEDTAPTLSTTGTLVVTDADNNQSAIDTTVAPTASEGALGAITIAADGSWTYNVENSSVDYLTAGETKVETFTVQSVDGTSHDISITITGTNDTPTFTIGTGADLGGVTEDAANPTLSTTGTLVVADADQNQSAIDPSAGVHASDGALGSISIAADGNWTYNVANSAVDYLAIGETKVETFTVQTVDGTSHDITITITGTNDTVEIGSAVLAGDATEDSGDYGATGTISFGDVDLIDAHDVTVTPGSEGYLGTFTTDLSDSTGTGSGSLGWNFSVDNAAVQYLAEGETVTQTYEVAIGDGTTQTVEITITGANDTVEIGSAVLAGDATEDSGDYGATGTISFGDVDLIDAHDVTVTPGSEGYLGTFTTDLSDSTGTGSGSLGWNFSVDNAAVQYLAEGETVTQTYEVAIGDGTTQTVEITITGANDTVEIGSAVLAGDATEDSGDYGATGTISFGDVDLIDVHEVTVTPGSEGYLGTFTTDLSDSTGTGSGSLGWNFSVDNAAVQYLAEGETVTQTYEVAIGDGTTQTVEITITGANDTVEIGSAVLVGEAVEDGVLTDSGTISFGDVDLIDAHDVTVTPGSEGYLGTFTTDLSDSTGTGSGSLGWNFSVDNAAVQYLAEGETVTQTYDVAIGDGTIQTVEITITGTNDVPVIVTSSGNEGGIPDVVDESGLATGSHAADASEFASGTFTVSDVDGLHDIQSVTINGVTASIGALEGKTFAGENGTLTVTDYDSNSGIATYTYELTKATKDGAGTESDVFTLTTSDGTVSSSSATITINIADDVPTAVNDSAEIHERGADTVVSGTYNVTVVLDTSGSMAGSKIDLAKAAINNLLTEYGGVNGANAANVHVLIVGFDDHTENSGWLNLAQANAYVADSSHLQAGGNTNYDLALTTTMTAYGEGPTGHAATDTNVLYFLSDGEPTVGGDSNHHLTTVAGGDVPTWEAFLAVHNMDAYAVGIGTTNTADQDLTAVAYSPDGGAANTPIIVAHAEDLDATLQTLVVPGPVEMVEGNVVSGQLVTFLGADTQGADGATVTAISHIDANGNIIDTVPVSGAMSSVLTTDLGTLTISADGHYHYTATAGVSQDTNDVFTYTLTDGDGDTDQATLTIKVIDGVPEAVADTDTATEGHWTTGGNVTYTDAITLPASWSAGTSEHNVTGHWHVNPYEDGPAVTGNTASFSLNADANHLASVEVKVQVSGYQSGDTVTVALFDADGQVGTSQTIATASDVWVTFNNISESGNYYVKVIAEDNSDHGDLSLKLTDLSYNDYTYTQAPPETITVTAPDLAWVAAAAVTGNVITNDTPGTDGGLVVTAVDHEGDASATSVTSGGINIGGDYGTLHIDSNGEYTYTPGASDMTGGESDIFHYTIRDADGDLSTAELKVTIEDHVYNSSGDGYLQGTSVDDNMTGGAGHDYMLGGAGNDTLNGGAGNDHLIGGDGNDVLNGGTGTNILEGGAGNDTLNGGADSDYLSGGAGNDILVGGAGNDILFGGVGTDTFKVGEGHDVITDYTKGEGDKVDIGFVIDTTTKGQLEVVNDGGKAELVIYEAGQAHTAEHVTGSVTFENINFDSTATGADDLDSLVGKVDFNHT